MLWPATPLDSITEDEIHNLVSAQVAEGTDVDFKAELPGNADADRREFLADVSSFANTVGGHLIFGVREAGGIAMEVTGVDLANPDAEKLRLENILRTSIDPRITGIGFRSLHLASGKHAFLIRIPRSWSAPHMVTFGGLSRFYGRNSSGKYQLDVRELRAAFLLGQTTSDRIRELRLDRVSRIKAEDTPVKVYNNPKVVLHVVPLGAFDSRTRIDTSRLTWDTPGFTPMRSDRRDFRHNFDGVLSYYDRGTDEPVHTYLQVFRNGVLEALHATMIQPDEQGNYIRSVVVEPELIESVTKYVQLERAMGLEPPYVVMLSLLDVRGYRIMPDTYNRHWDSFRLPVDRDDLLTSDLLIETAQFDAAALLRPAFDEVWNAGGWERSRNYNEDGTYRRPKY